MSVAQRVAKNSLVLLASEVITYLLFFISGMFTARHLGPASYGILSFGVAYTALFVVLTDLGLSFVTIRDVSRDKSLASKYFANVGLMKVLLAVLTITLIAVTMNVGKIVMGYPQQTITVVYLIGLSVAFTGINQMCFSLFRAFERMEYQSLGQIVRAALMLAGVIIAVKIGFGVVGFASLYFFASLGTLACSLTILGWKFSNYQIWSHLRTAIDWGFWKPALKQAFPFALSLIFITINFSIDTVMLSAMVPESDKVVGLYTAAFRLLVMLLSIRMALSLALFPVMSQAHATSKESLKLISERFFKYSLILALPIGVGTTILATRFISLVYGSEYLSAALALQILVWSAVLGYVNFTSSVFQATNRQAMVAKLTGFGAVLNILLNLLLIPFFGYIGAAASTTAVAVVVLSISLVIIARTEYALGIPFAVRNVTKVLIASAAMGCFVWYLQDLNLAILVILGALVYAAAIVLTKTFDRTDLHILTGVVRNEAVLTKLDTDQAG
ncbi:MAG: oligosaccharide flippase family protein [Dehalococcoidia bacterium]